MRKMIVMTSLLSFACGAHDSTNGGARAELSDGEATRTNSSEGASNDPSMQTDDDEVETVSADDAEEPVGELTKVVLRYRDGSVPPEYHRSYVIVVEAEQVTATVDVYGDEIAGANYEMPRSDWSALQEQSQSLEWPGQDVDTLEQVGGPLFTLELHTAASTRRIAWTSGAASGQPDVTAFVQTIEQLAPDLESLKATEYDG